MSAPTGGGALPAATARKLRKSADEMERWTLDRNRLIAEASAAGASLREIAEHAGITHVAVRNIIRKGMP